MVACKRIYAFFRTAWRAVRKRLVRQFAPLPPEVSESLKAVNWQERDVLVGVLRNQAQLQTALRCRFYHIPASQIGHWTGPIRYIAIYQSKTLFGDRAGVRWYGAVQRRDVLPRKNITEIPSRKETPYCRFSIREWKCLETAVLPKEGVAVANFTNRFLLEHSRELPQLWLESEEEYRLYDFLSQLLDASAKSRKLRFSCGEVDFLVRKGLLTITCPAGTVGTYSLEAFSEAPLSFLREIERDAKSHGCAGYFRSLSPDRCAQGNSPRKTAQK